MPNIPGVNIEEISCRYLDFSSTVDICSTMDCSRGRVSKGLYSETYIMEGVKWAYLWNTIHSGKIER